MNGSDREEVFVLGGVLLGASRNQQQQNKDNSDLARTGMANRFFNSQDGRSSKTAPAAYSTPVMREGRS